MTCCTLNQLHIHIDNIEKEALSVRLTLSRRRNKLLKKSRGKPYLHESCNRLPGNDVRLLNKYASYTDFCPAVPAFIHLSICSAVNQLFHQVQMANLCQVATFLLMIMHDWGTVVARIALVKPDKARGVENMVLQMAQRGALTERVRHDFLAIFPGCL